MGKTLLLIFLFLSIAYSSNLGIIKFLPTNIMSGSIYETEYSLTQETSDDWTLIFNLSGNNIDGREFDLGGCTYRNNETAYYCNIDGKKGGNVKINISINLMITNGTYRFMIYAITKDKQESIGHRWSVTSSGGGWFSQERIDRDTKIREREVEEKIEEEEEIVIEEIIEKVIEKEVIEEIIENDTKTLIRKPQAEAIVVINEETSEDHSLDWGLMLIVGGGLATTVSVIAWLFARQRLKKRRGRPPKNRSL